MATIEFILNGRRYELRSETVESRLADVEPEAIRSYAVRVGSTWYPVKQAFEVALGVPRADYTSHTARRHLLALNFEVRGQMVARNDEPRPHIDRPIAMASFERPEDRTGGEWHTEANVQARVVTALAADRWKIISVANTATKERGIDVVAMRDGQTAGVEVKGYPSRAYADPARAGEQKRTAPSNQAGHWYSQAVLAAMRLRGKNPAWRSVIALPDFNRYRDLYAETAGSLSAASIEVWWVSKDGTVETG